MNEAFEERQKRENEKYYERWLACGFTGEMKLNEYGWFIPVLRLHYPVETLKVFDAKGYRASIEFCHLPNGHWVAASDLTCPTHGYGSACSVWDTQYETKEEAIMAELDRIEKALEDKDRKPFVGYLISDYLQSSTNTTQRIFKEHFKLHYYIDFRFF